MIAQLIAPYLMGRFGHTGPNQPAALNPAGASSSDSGHRWRRAVSRVVGQKERVGTDE